VFRLGTYKLFSVIALLLLQSISVVFGSQLVDPTRPPGAAVQKHSLFSIKNRSPWRLSSTLIARERKIATINGKIVRQGERINGATVIDIQAWNVTLRKNKKTFKVYLFSKNKIRKKNR